MTEFVSFILGLKQDVARTLAQPSLQIEVSERAHDERPKQPNFTFTRNTKGSVEGSFCLRKMASHQLYDANAVIGCDHIIRSIIGFSQIARLLGAALRVVELAHRSVDNCLHHAAENEKARTGRTWGYVSGIASKQRTRPSYV